ncbi:hypothetical protein ACQCU1_08395 [Sutcliffiella horikoshii]|uniref:YhjD n=1 Tax=Sutcliffiella horikoshii TaxID=79883 RepID=A0A1Y0CKX3_9BACI|nr:hypothetical protein [Sutcliffiella horikoshii]ART75714.1 hypothetical protein B4U37_06595 [Sutcliffiella horikoshii]TYS60996.1 hypothetical protein FZC74_01595 [Sutcliffiella horikoshii]
MTRLSKEQIYLFEQAIYLPLLLIVLERDTSIIKDSGIKLKEPYLTLIDQVMRKIQLQLKQIKADMKQQQMKLHKLKQDESFTMYAFLFNGYEEHHNYFNPRIRNKVNELLMQYILRMEESSISEK